MSVRKTVLLFVLIFLLFGALLIFAVTRDDSSSDAGDEHWYTNALHSLFGERRALSPADVIGDCVTGAAFRVRPGRPCTVRLRTSGVAIRGFRLTLAAGLKAGIELRPRGENSIPIRVPLRSQVPQTPNLQALKEGADLTLACEQALDPVAGCVISLTAPK
ncbi:MAG: hypothetical protein KIT09_25640 [Bryobacteraceae bacterium]|nr:hypothetical protein [Bryobacteraceae bacterium]